MSEEIEKQDVSEEVTHQEPEVANEAITEEEELMDVLEEDLTEEEATKEDLKEAFKEVDYSKATAEQRQAYVDSIFKQNPDLKELIELADINDQPTAEEVKQMGEELQKKFYELNYEKKLTISKDREESLKFLSVLTDYVEKYYHWENDGYRTVVGMAKFLKELSQEFNKDRKKSAIELTFHPVLALGTILEKPHGTGVVSARWIDNNKIDLFRIMRRLNLAGNTFLFEDHNLNIDKYVYELASQSFRFKPRYVENKTPYDLDKVLEEEKELVQKLEDAEKAHKALEEAEKQD